VIASYPTAPTRVTYKKTSKDKDINRNRNIKKSKLNKKEKEKKKEGEKEEKRKEKRIKKNLAKIKKYFTLLISFKPYSYLL
jgi:hypothetical protein